MVDPSLKLDGSFMSCKKIYPKILDFSDTNQLYCKHSKNLTNTVIPQNDANGIANSVEPEETSHIED